MIDSKHVAKDLLFFHVARPPPPRAAAGGMAWRERLRARPSSPQSALDGGKPRRGGDQSIVHRATRCANTVSCANGPHSADS